MTRRPQSNTPKDISSSIERWLTETQSGYRDLNPTIKSALMYFMVTWSIFEFKALDSNGNIDSLRRLSDRVGDSDESLAKFTRPFDYFRERYVNSHRVNEDFRYLVGGDLNIIRPVREALLEHRNTSGDKVFGLLLIVYCLRNNLFHGLKWKWGVDDQYDNFTHATFILIDVLDELSSKEITLS